MSETWTKAAERRVCASNNCGNPAAWHLESGGVGSDYCEHCHNVIEALDDCDLDGAGDGYCEHCHNTGELDCHCGGDLCVCENNGTYPCPHCS